MNENKQEAINEISKKIADLRSIVKQIQDLPDMPEWVTIWAGTWGPCLTFPASNQNLKEIRRRLGPTWRLKRRHHNDDSIISAYTNGNKEITLYARTTLPGAICEKKVIGQKTVDVYEIVCS